MNVNEYPIYDDHGRLFCIRRLEGEVVIIEGPKGRRLSLSSFIKQACDSSTACKNRGKRQHIKNTRK